MDDKESESNDRVHKSFLGRSCFGMKSLLTNSLTLSCIVNRMTQVRNLSKSTMKIKTLFFLSIFVDLVLGWFIQCRIVEEFKLKLSPADVVYSAMDLTVHHLKSLLTWLMENPAGLKLNSVFSHAVGKFFLYHIHLWVTYVYLVVPISLSVLPPLSSVTTLVPVSLQVSLLGDFFTCLTIHVYCFYAYARRLFYSQFKGWMALMRLLINKKYNPLRNRIDSADATVEQLLIGTIVFTILSFLFPTTLAFFGVFYALKTVASLILKLVQLIVKAVQYVPS